MSAIPIITVVCQYCSKPKHPKEVQRFGDGIIRCFDCAQRDDQAIECFNPPDACGLCRTSFNDLAAAEKREHVSMYPHFIDGVYVLLCEACNFKHVQKRKDLYRGTRYGWEQKI